MYEFDSTWGRLISSFKLYKDTYYYCPNKVVPGKVNSNSLDYGIKNINGDNNIACFCIKFVLIYLNV